MPALKVKRLAQHVCPPVLWQVSRWCYRRLRPRCLTRRMPTTVRHVISTRAEVEAMIARCIAAAGGCLDRQMRTIEEYHFRIPRRLPADPYSAEYRAAQMGLYRLISGRDHYDAETSEQTPLDLDRALLRPYPYDTHSSLAVGDQLAGVAQVIQALELSRPARVLELGSGYGKLTTELAQLGHEVTAVDVSPTFLELGRRRCRMLGLDVVPVCAGMLDYRPEGRFDRVVFHKSFHHCGDPEAMVRRLDDLVAPGGKVIFASEPIDEAFYCPWGVRLDGEAIFVIGHHGWLELGFSERYFLSLLGRYGWRADHRPCYNDARHGVYVARRR